MVTITVHGLKGGSGKSSIAINLAYCYSKQGLKVLIIDGDYLAPCLESYFPPKGRFNPFISFLQGESNLEEVISKTLFTNLYASHAPPHLGIAEEWISADASMQEIYLQKLREGIKEAHKELGFDKVIIDNASGITPPTINQFACSDQSILVIRPERYSIESTYQLVHSLYKKLRSLSFSSQLGDFLVWNQVPVPPESPDAYKIHAYLTEWEEKFAEAGISQGTTIPYSSHIAVEMIVYGQIDLPRMFFLMEPYIDEVARKLYEASER